MAYAGKTKSATVTIFIIIMQHYENRRTKSRFFIARKCKGTSSYKKQELRILRKYYQGSPRLFYGVRVAHLLSFLCSFFCRRAVS